MLEFIFKEPGRVLGSFKSAKDTDEATEDFREKYATARIIDIVGEEDEGYKCIKPGWIKLADFVNKYHPGLTSHKRENKHSRYRLLIKKFPNKLKDKPGRATFVVEREFCIHVGIEYKEGEIKE